VWERLVGRRNAKRSSGASAPLSGALGRVGGLLGHKETKKHARTDFGGPVGLVFLGALAVVATVSVVLVLRRRAASAGSPVVDPNEEAIEPNEQP
jgi:hypothetical protein